MRLLNEFMATDDINPVIGHFIEENLSCVVEENKHLVVDVDRLPRLLATWHF